MKKIISLLLVCLLVIILAAYGQTSMSNDAEDTMYQETSADSEQSGYPVMVVSYNGNGQTYEQTFEQAPKRIVCNQPQAIQLLLRLGLKDKVVGACRSVGDVGEDYKEDFESLNFISEGDIPSKELVIDQQPDIIIGWGSTFGEDTLGDVSEWNEQGIHTYAMENTVSNAGARTVERLYTDIEKLGMIFGIQDEAQQVIDEMRSTLDMVEEKVSQLSDSQRLRVLTVQQTYENEFYGRANTDLTTNMIELAGGISLDEESGKQSIENLIKLNPDVILVINRTDSPAEDKIDALINNSLLQSVPAVANNRFVIVDYVDFYGGNAETVDTIEQMAKEFYPELFSTDEDTDHYPVTVQTYNENGEILEQVFESCPQRVVSISQANTELLIALGLGDKIVATAHRFSPVYEVMENEYNSIPFIAEEGYPSKEVVLEQEPDMLVGWGSLFAEDALGSVETWHERGIYTYLMSNTVSGLGNRTVEFLYDDIEELGKIFNVEEEAEATIFDMKERISAITEKVSEIPEQERVNVVTIQYIYENEFLGRGGSDLVHNLAELAGGNHISENGKQNMEVLVDLNPDVIIVLDLSTSPAQEKIDAILENPTLQNINAVKNNRFVVLEHSAFYCGGPRTFEAIETLAEGFYPELFL